MTLQSNIGIALQRIRKQRNISQEQLALEADIDRRYMSDIENGKRNISLDILERLSKSLGLSVSNLVGIAESLDKEPFTVDSLKEYLCEYGYEESVVFENPDYASAVIGVDTNGRVIYDFDLMVEFLMKEDGMDYDEAVEFIDYNTIGSLPYAGENAPIILNHINN
ncbi:MAG: helix-turn-helix domain-containing protein [Bacteroidales bacterium]|nr:helix-turn-helix domain-containing protein [Bacteroidales bacterium]